MHNERFFTGTRDLTTQPEEEAIRSDLWHSMSKQELSGELNKLQKQKHKLYDILYSNVGASESLFAMLRNMERAEAVLTNLINNSDKK